MLRTLLQSDAPLPAEFLAWQVRLRRWTMEKRAGAPHVGVAPLLVVRQSGTASLATVHSIICGLLPHARHLQRKTDEFRALYEAHVADGARALYDAGIAYLHGYYETPDAFDPASITTLLPTDVRAVQGLRAEPRCALVFHVFDVGDTSEIGRMRCLQLDCHAEVLDAGPVYDNVWWHNALFHGPMEGQVVIRFRHLRTWDTRFGGLEPLEA